MRRKGNSVTRTTKEHGRITPIDRNEELYPCRRAYALTKCFLYWIPVSGFPAPSQQRQWLLEFFERLGPLLKREAGLRSEVFFQYKTVPEVEPAFRKTATEFSPFIGLSRKPGAELPRYPTEEDLALVAKGERKFDLKEWAPDYCFWFLNKAGKRQRQEFLGYGGLSHIFLKPDPSTTPPQLPISRAARKKYEVLRLSQLEEMMVSACALKDGFLAKSKQLFGAGLEADPQFPGIPYILPQLATVDFFNQPDEECNKWFELFDVYVRESVEDDGILMASKLDFEESLVSLITQMRAEGMEYPER